MKDKQYINFIEQSQTGKTLIFNVASTRDESLLGVVKWYSRWRQYAFFPKTGTLYNIDCMRKIAGFIDDLMYDRNK